MKTLLIAFLLNFSAPNKDIVGYRELLHKSYYSEDLAQLYYKRTSQINAGSLPVLRGYKAMAEFVMIKYTFNPFSKLSHFNKGRKELDAALQADPGNVELVFLRFATQVNAPSFLGYNNNIASDKTILYNFAVTQNNSTDDDLKGKVTTFLLNSKHTSAAEKRKLKQVNKTAP